MADARCTTEWLEAFAGLGMAACIAIVAALAYVFWALYFRPLIADWRRARRRRG